MSSEWFAIFIQQFLCISVVSTNKHLSIHIQNGIHCFANTFINYLNCFYRCFHDTGMTYHIRICEVYDNDIVFIRTNRFYQIVANFIGTHLRLHIKRSYFWRVYKNTVFSFKLLLFAAIKEKCNMCILLCLSQTKLFFTMFCQIFTKCHF